MTTITQYDAANKRTVTMEKLCGVQYRTNTIQPGGQIEFHAHDFAHNTEVKAGWFDVLVVKDGVEDRFQMAGIEFITGSPDFNPRSSREIIPAFASHAMTLREPGKTGVGVIECSWGEA